EQVRQGPGNLLGRLVSTEDVDVDLLPRESGWRLAEGRQDDIRDGVAQLLAEDVARRVLAVLPHRQGCGQVVDRDDMRLIEHGVNHGKAHDNRFCSSDHGPQQPDLALAQRAIDPVPGLAGLIVTVDFTYSLREIRARTYALYETGQVWLSTAVG